METYTLKVNTRKLEENIEKSRKQGVIPAVVYGNKIQSKNLFLNSGEFSKIFKKAGESTVINLTDEANKIIPVIVQAVQYHPVKSDVIHVDFYAVDMKAKLTAKVSIEFIGEAPAVKTSGGVLVKSLNEVEVECLPADLPHNVSVDISVLKSFTDAIHLKDLKMGDKVKILGNPEDVIAKVQAPRDVEAELAAPVVEDISKVEGAAEDKPVATEAKKE